MHSRRSSKTVLLLLVPLAVLSLAIGFYSSSLSGAFMQRVFCPRPPFNSTAISPLLQRICQPKLAAAGADLKLVFAQSRSLASTATSTTTIRPKVSLAAPAVHHSSAVDNSDTMTVAQAADQSTGSLFWDSQVSLKEAFLASLAAEPSSSNEPWVVVMGNEAGDLDSLASSLAHAFFLNTVEGTRAVPLILTPRAALRLRPENEMALRLTRPEAGQETLGSLEEILLCIDDLPVSPSDLVNRGVRFTLVDHNALLGPFRQNVRDAALLDSTVVGILDHHADDGAHTAAKPRIIDTTAASCASIVATYWTSRLPVNATGLGGQPLVPSEVTRLLLSAILIDSNGLKAGGKANDIDWRAVEFLWRLTGLDSAKEGVATGAVASISAADRQAPPNLKQLADELNDVKNNVSHLSLPDLLARDYKAYGVPSAYLQSAPEVHLGLASVPVSLKTILTRESPATPWATLVDGLEAFAKQEQLTLLGVLTSFKSETKGKRKRELLLYTPPSVDAAEAARLWGSFAPRLEANELLSLDVWKPASGPDAQDGWASEWAGGRGKVWSQKKADATRKTVAPVLREVLSGSAVEE